MLKDQVFPPLELGATKVPWYHGAHLLQCCQTNFVTKWLLESRGGGGMDGNIQSFNNNYEEKLWWICQWKEAAWTKSHSGMLMTFHTLLSPFTTFCQIQFVVDSKNIWMSKCIIEMCYPVHLAICIPETHANHGPAIVSWSFWSGAKCSQIFWGIQRYWPEEFATNSVISKPRGQNHEPGQVCCWEFGQSRQVLTSTVDHRCKTCLQLCRGVRKFYMNLQVKTKKLTCFAPMLMTS